MVFFCAFHEFVRIIQENKHKQSQSSENTDGEVPLLDMHAQGTRVCIECRCMHAQGTKYLFTCNHLFFYVGDETAPTTVVQRLGSELVKSTYALLSSYWVLVVIVAFLLVFLSGEPSLFKTIYLIFFFVFLITYQVSLVYTCIRNGVYKNYVRVHVNVHVCLATFELSFK